MTTSRLGIIMHGVTGRMGTNQHLIRSIVALRKEGGVRLSDGSRVMPDPILIGRDAAKIEALAKAHDIVRFGTNLDAALASREDSVFFDAGTTQMRPTLLAKAIAAGASSVMMGGMFAGTEEAPGEIVLYQGRSYKSYRGMGSIGAMQQGSADRYFQEASTGNPNADKLVPEGIEGRVPYKGSVVAIVYQLAGGVRASMGYCGCASIDDMKNRAEFVEITSAGMRESHVHDVQITKEAPNYRAD